MKKLLVLMLVLALADFASAELLSNTSFEIDAFEIDAYYDAYYNGYRCPDGWHIKGKGQMYDANTGLGVPMKANPTLMTDGGHTGNNYIATTASLVAPYDVSGWGWSSIWHFVPVTPGITYTASAFARDGLGVGGAVARVGFRWHDGTSAKHTKETAISEKFIDIADGAGVDWTYVEASATAPVGAETLEMCFVSVNTSTDYDDVSLVPEPLNLALLGMGGSFLCYRKKY